MATITDIARVCGVSTASVSYVLNNRQGSVSVETRERVLQTMRDLNYRPGPLFTRKQREGSLTVGVGYMHQNVTALTDYPWTTMLLDGILSCTVPLGADVMLMASLEWGDMRNTLREKYDGRCDGLLLLGLPEESNFVEVLQERGIPFVCVNFGAGLKNVSYVDVDNVVAATEATQFLLDLGHTRIALLSGNHDYADTLDRKRGYSVALKVAGIALEPQFIPTGVYSEESGYEQALQLLSLPQDKRPTALFCGNDRIATGALKAARELNINVPEQLSVMGFDDVPDAARTQPALTTVHQPLVEIGRRATEILMQHINEHTPSGQAEILPTQIIVRQSTAPCHSTGA